jgi:hypothetical protein
MGLKYVYIDIRDGMGARVGSYWDDLYRSIFRDEKSET